MEERLAAGVAMHGPDMVRMGPYVTVEPGAELFGPCELYGHTHIASDVIIESHCVIRDSRVESGAVESMREKLAAVAQTEEAGA